MDTVRDSSTKRKDTNKMDPKRDSDGEKFSLSGIPYTRNSHLILDRVDAKDIIHVFDSVC